MFMYMYAHTSSRSLANSMSTRVLLFGAAVEGPSSLRDLGFRGKPQGSGQMT